MFQKKQLFLWFFCLLALLSLSACGIGNLFKSNDYHLSGLPKNAPLAKEMDKFLHSRAATIQKAKKKSDQPRQEKYEETVLQGDLIKELQAKGYYDAKVSFKAAAKKAWAGDFAIETGQQYKISGIATKPKGAASLLPDVLTPGIPLDATVVLTAQSKLRTAAGKNQCYFTLDVQNAVTLNRMAKTGHILFTVQHGAKSHFAEVDFTGQKTVRTNYLYKQIPWKYGDCFDRDKIESFRTTLFATGLFSRVDTIYPAQPHKDGSVPLTFQLKERAPRSISAGVSYYTTEGPGVTFGWTHRNLFGAGETLANTATISQLIQKISTTLTKPFFLRKDQTLTLNTDLDHEDTDAYRTATYDVGAAIKRTLTPHLTGSTGVAFTVSHIDDKSTLEKDNYALVSFPQNLTFDNRDNALDSHHGWLLEGLVSPYVDAFGQSSPFLKTQGGARTYIPVLNDLTLALRVKVGSILGPSTANIPATERFYSGGGGSVRGFGYQDIGPFRNGQPQGGRSLAELSGEWRYKINSQFGLVTFLDAGSVTPSLVPDFSNLSIGTGAGVRYYTAFGPIRFDVGVPLNNREQASGNYQLYISIGQAF